MRGFAKDGCTECERESWGRCGWGGHKRLLALIDLTVGFGGVMKRYEVRRRC